MSMLNVPRITLYQRIPGHASEFVVDRNCSAIEVRETGITIRDPMTEPNATHSAGMRCAYSLLVTSWGWAKLEPGDETLLRCEHCGDEFAQPQGLASHIKSRHPDVTTIPSKRTMYRREAEQRNADMRAPTMLNNAQDGARKVGAK